MNLEKLYQQTILDYSSRKDLKKDLEDPTFVERGHNPNCGDDLTLEIKVNENNIIEDASFVGNGCAISSASTAMLIDLVKGKSIEEAKEKVELFFRMMKLGDSKEELSDDQKNELGDAVLLEYVAGMPARIRCATLSWHSLKEIIEKNEKK